MDNSMIIPIAISFALFILSLLIFFSARVADKKSRSLANVTAQIKSFRNEVSATTQRLLTSSQDCTDNVMSHIEQARTIVDIISTSLDRLSQHQKDLTQLEGICVDYQRALDKLRTQTEQAENRIAIVQQEIRKAESVSEFVKAFHEESELLVNQMQDLKSEYVRLVTSTQEALKQQAALQKSDNSEALSQFSSAMERQKAQLVEFIHAARADFERECSEQTKIASSLTERILDKRAELDDDLRALESSRIAIKEDLKAFFDDTKASLEALRAEMAETIESMERDAEDEKRDLENKSAESSESLSKAYDALSRDYENKKASLEILIEEKLNAFDERIAAREEKLRQALDKAALVSEEKSEKEAEDFRELEKMKAEAETLAEKTREADALSDTASPDNQSSDAEDAEKEESLEAEDLNKEEIEEGREEETDAAQEEEAEAGDLLESEAVLYDEDIENEISMDDGMIDASEISMGESIIEEFPDIFIGEEEEIDLGDDD